MKNTIYMGKMRDNMNRKIEVTTNEEEPKKVQKKSKRFRFRYDILAAFIILILIITFIIYMVQTTVYDIV